MIKRLWFPVVAVLLALVLIVMIVWNLWWGTTRLPVAERMPDFALTNTAGEQVTLPSLDNKIKVLTFVFTNCPDACPMTLHSMMNVQEDLKKEGLFGKEVVFLSVTMDPENDTPEKLVEYSKMFNADLSGGWHFLRGSRADTDKLMGALNIPAQQMENGLYQHSNRVYLIDGNRNVRKTYDLTTDGSDEITDDLKTLADE